MMSDEGGYRTRIDEVRRRVRKFSEPPLAETGGCLKQLALMHEACLDLLILCDELAVLAEPELRAQKKLRAIMDAMGEEG